MAFNKEKSQREVGRILFSLERLRCLFKLTPLMKIAKKLLDFLILYCTVLFPVNGWES